ncbi:MAG: hypothetical protein LBI63_01805 [Candidatus Ancillula sp.]|jgi:hypothetical protein|nr:hypothetical protein [Candidatus Ancillula sp.]
MGKNKVETTEVDEVKEVVLASGGKEKKPAVEKTDAQAIAEGTGKSQEKEQLEELIKHKTEELEGLGSSKKDEIRSLKEQLEMKTWELERAKKRDEAISIRDEFKLKSGFEKFLFAENESQMREKAQELVTLMNSQMHEKTIIENEGKRQVVTKQPKTPVEFMKQGFTKGEKK